MQPIPIKRTREDLNRQVSFITKLSDRTSLLEHKTPALFLFCSTCFVFLLFTLSGSDEFVTLKAVSSILMTLLWVIALIYAVVFFIKRYRAHDAVRTVFNNALIQEIQEYITFDEQGITITTKDYTLEHHWSYYSNYLEDDLALYLFIQGPTFLVMCYSAAEIGDDNLIALKEIVRKKLEPLYRQLRLI